MIQIQRAQKGHRYQSHQLPDSSNSLGQIIWTRQGPNEEFDVVLTGTKITVKRQEYIEERGDWQDFDVDPETVDLTVYLP